MKNITADLKAASDPNKIPLYQRFFKTGKGQYGEGDIFIGLTVPQQRTIAKRYSALTLRDIQQLLKNPIHEFRLTALLILVSQFQRTDIAGRQKIVDFYLKNTEYINNWDLVDLSADKILGEYLFNRSEIKKTRYLDSIQYRVLTLLSESDNLWVRRIAIISTFAFIKKGQFEPTLRIVTLLIEDKQDLIHKAIGWMLREIGKQDEKTLTDFLDKNYTRLPRTSLRYAIERLTSTKRNHYLAK